MANVITLYLLIFLSTSTHCLDVSEIEVPTTDGVSGVFLIQTKTYQYSFDSTTAKKACEAIKMRIATKAEVETANKNGFQTCRFGWVEELIAVLPRVEKNVNCGKNTLGVSVWRADINKKFDVYCFKPAGSLATTSSRPQTTTGGRTPVPSSTQFLQQTSASTVPPALSQTTTANKPSVIVSTSGISGVFLIQSKTYQYSFDATTAQKACEAIKMRIATMAEVETANKNGFQTCRFGWVEEQIAVLPRVEKNENCGKNSLGVSAWRADINTKFDVYCFNPAGSLETTSSRPQTTTGGRTPVPSSTQFLQQTSASTVPPALSQTTTTNKPSVIVSTNGISGVFLIQSKTYQYSFDATTAKNACEAIKMRIATMAEVETANKNGFQTCRFGWVEEQIAVLPRVEKNENCGKNSLGISAWKADSNTKFDVYCFKPAGLFETTSSRPQTPTKTTQPSSTMLSYTSTQSTPFTFSTSPTTFRTVSPRSLSSPSTSPKFSTSFPSSSPLFSTQFLLQQTLASTGHPGLSQTTPPNTPSVRVAPETFVIISVIILVLLLTAGGAAWCLKKKREQRFPSWISLRTNPIMETEMFKRISERHCFPERTNKDNNNWTYDNIILQMELDPDTL